MRGPDQELPVVVSRPQKGIELQLIDALSDINLAIRLWPIWLALSWVEFNTAYKRSIIGVLWVVLSFTAFVFIKITIFSSLLDSADPGYYDAYLVLGFFTWNFLSPSIISAPETFVNAQGWIRSEPLPYSLYVFKAIMREFYNFGLISIVTVGALLYLGREFTWMALCAFPAVAFYMVTAFSLKMLLGVLGARLRDTTHLFRAIMLPMMFLTPIFWMPSQMPGLMRYLWWNPLFHFIEIVRAPILDSRFPTESWTFCGCVFLTISVVALALFSRFRSRIVYWF